MLYPATWMSYGAVKLKLRLATLWVDSWQAQQLRS